MNADKKEQKLIDALTAYAESNPARFHMPGHKGFSDDRVLKTVCPFDVTELNATDDLYHASGALKRLQQRFAALYSAKASFLLVNGSTAGNTAMLLSLGCGKNVLLGRDCHRSALSGIALAGHEIISVFPDTRKGVITPEAVEKAFLNAEEPFDAVFLTSPNYYGKVLNVERIVEIVHSRGALLFIDAAHGAHFPFSNLLPENPSCADAWVVSCHKTLGALTQTAVLNLGVSNKEAPEKMLDALALTQTSSPSFPLMRSLESVLDAPWNWDAHCERLIAFRKKLSKIKGLSVEGTVCEPFSPSEKHIGFDITRLALSFFGINGFALGEYLEQKGIYAEMSDAKCVVLITSPVDPDEWYSRLYDALSEISLGYANENRKISGTEKLGTEINEAFDFPHIQKTSVRAAMLGNSHKIPLFEAEGKICARAVGIYPPGAAILFPGEKIEKAALKILQRYKTMGAKLFGAENGMICVLTENGNGNENGNGEPVCRRLRKI